jgi:hypothetical protein
MWLWLAALIEGTKGEALIDNDGDKWDGLCLVTSMMQADEIISSDVACSARIRIRRALGGKIYLTRAHSWNNGARRDWCLKFAEQCK